MKPVKLFVMETCPYCVQARKYLGDLMKLEKYAHVEVEIIDEVKDADRANQYDYYYVPTFYLGNEKVSEGVVSKEKVQEILDCAI